MREQRTRASYILQCTGYSRDVAFFRVKIRCVPRKAGVTHRFGDRAKYCPCSILRSV